MPSITRRIQFNRGFFGKAVPRDKPVGGFPDAQNVLVTKDGTSLVPMPGYARTYPYPLLNGLSAWKHNTTGAVVYAASNPDSANYTQDYGLRVVSLPPQALLLSSGRALAIVDEYNGRVVALGYHAGGNALRAYSTEADRAPYIEGRLFRQSSHEYPSVVYYDGKTFFFSAWNEPKVYDGETLRPVGLRAPQLAPVAGFDGDELVLDCDPTQWTGTAADNPYVGRPNAGTDYWWKRAKATYTSFPTRDCFWEFAQNGLSAQFFKNIKWNAAWSPAPLYNTGAPMVRTPGVTFRCDVNFRGAGVPHTVNGTEVGSVLCQHNLAPNAFANPLVDDSLTIPSTCQSIVFNVYYDCQHDKVDGDFDGIQPSKTGKLALVFSSVKIPVSATAPYAPTADIIEDPNCIIIPITQGIERGRWNKIELAWPGETDFALRSVGIVKIKDIPWAQFLPKKYNLHLKADGVTPANWVGSGTASEFFVRNDAGGLTEEAFVQTLFDLGLAVDFTFNLRWKQEISSNTTFQYDDDYYFAFSWKNSVSGRESAPSPISKVLAVKAGMPVRLNLRGTEAGMTGFPAGHWNTAPVGADKVCVYMARAQWGTDETTQEPLLRLLGEYDIPTNGLLSVGSERDEADIFVDRGPNYSAYSPPACALAAVDGNRLLLAGQKDYAIGQVTVASYGAFQVVTGTTTAVKFGPWCEGRALHIEGQAREGLIIKACPATDGDYHSLLVLDGAAFLSEESNAEEQYTLDSTPRNYTVKAAPRRMWWTSLTGQYGVDMESYSLTNYMDVDVSPDGVNWIGHVGGIVCVASRDRAIYLAQNQGALDDLSDMTGVAFSASSSKPFSIGCLAGRSFQEIPGKGGAVWLTPDCGLAVANTEGVEYHPASEVLRSYLQQADKASQFELQHAFAHFNKADGGYYLFFYGPSGEILTWDDAFPSDPFIEEL